MKFFFDLFPVALFYAAFQYARSDKAWAAEKASAWLGFMISGGAVGPDDAPTVLATVVLVIALALQIVIMKAMRKPVSTILWVGLGLALIFGAATVWFHSKTLIMWKFTVLYWMMAAAFFLSALIWKRNLVQALMKEAEIDLPAPVFARLNLAWIAFFILMGLVNIYIAYNMSEQFWYNFKMFISPALMFVFILGQGLMLAKHLPKEEEK
jgi:intracellular septation protein